MELHQRGPPATDANGRRVQALPPVGTSRSRRRAAALRHLTTYRQRLMACHVIREKASATPLLKVRARPLRIALVGNPNVGKSVVFGRLTGQYVTVSNYPGTT